MFKTVCRPPNLWCISVCCSTTSQIPVSYRMPRIPILPDVYSSPPNIDSDRIPADQMPALLHICELLAELGLYQRHFMLAVYLFEYSTQAAFEIADFAILEDSLWTTGGWQMMAARDGALTIYHFGRAAEGLQNSLSFCPALSEQIDRKQVSSAIRSFQSAFPHNIDIRNAISHVADSSSTLTQKLSHAILGPFKTKRFSSEDPNSLTWLPGNLNGTTYAVSLKGKIFTYEVDRNNAEILRNVKQLIYNVFEPASKPPPEI